MVHFECSLPIRNPTRFHVSQANTKDLSLSPPDIVSGSLRMFSANTKPNAILRAPSDHKKPVTSPPLEEAMAYVTKSRSRAAGAELKTRGSIASYIYMGSGGGGFGFGSEHSAEWIYDIQQTYPFWEQVAGQFEIHLPKH